MLKLGLLVVLLLTLASSVVIRSHGLPTHKIPRTISSESTRPTTYLERVNVEPAQDDAETARHVGELAITGIDVINTARGLCTAKGEILVSDCSFIPPTVAAFGSLHAAWPSCLTFTHGSCRMTFCPQPGYAFAGDGMDLGVVFLHHLVEPCAAQAKWGVAFDCLELDFGCGGWRMYLSDEQWVPGLGR